MKERILALHSPPSEEKPNFIDHHFQNFFEMAYGTSRVATFENTFDIFEKLKNKSHHGKEENFARYNDADMNNARTHFVGNNCSYSISRSVETENIQGKDRRHSDLGPHAYSSFNGPEFSALLNEAQHCNEFNSIYKPQDERGTTKGVTGMVESIKKNGTIVPHILVQSKQNHPHLITPISPENSKLNIGTRSFLGVDIDFGQEELTPRTDSNYSFEGTNFNSKAGILQSNDFNERSRFNNQSDLYNYGTIQTEHSTCFESFAHPHSHSHPDIQQIDIKSTDISYEELRNIIVDNFASSGLKDKKSTVLKNNNDCKDRITDIHLSSDFHENESVLQQILNDGPLMEAISKKQKRGAYKCAHCPQMFNTIFEFAKHIDENKVERKYKCPFPLCPWKILGLPKLHELKRHCINQHYNELSPELQFLISGKKGPTLQVYQCEAPFCDKTFHRKDSYRRHVMMVHENRTSRFNTRLEKALKTCPEQIRRDPVRRNKFLNDKMKHRRKQKLKSVL